MPTTDGPTAAAVRTACCAHPTGCRGWPAVSAACCSRRCSSTAPVTSHSRQTPWPTVRRPMQWRASWIYWHSVSERTISWYSLQSIGQSDGRVGGLAIGASRALRHLFVILRIRRAEGNQLKRRDFFLRIRCVDSPTGRRHAFYASRPSKKSSAGLFGRATYHCCSAYSGKAMEFSLKMWMKTSSKSSSMTV